MCVIAIGTLCVLPLTCRRCILPRMEPDEQPPPNLQEKLKQYEEAYRQEFELADAPSPKSLDQIRQNTATKLLQAVPDAVERILYLMEHGEKDSTQLAAAKFIIANALGKESIGETSDPLAHLLNELTKGKRDSDKANSE